MIDLKLNHKNENGQFIGPYRLKDKILCEKFKGIGEISYCYGWNKEYGCYFYNVKFNGGFGHVPEYELKPAISKKLVLK